MAFVTGTTAAAGDTAIIAAPGAGKHIVIRAISVQNEVATANTLQLKNGATAFWRKLCQTQGSGFEYLFANGHEWHLDINVALNLNLSAATSVGYSVEYQVV